MTCCQGLLVTALLAHGETTWTTVEFLLSKHETLKAANDVASATDFGCFWVLVPHLVAPTVADDREQAWRLELAGPMISFGGREAVVETLVRNPALWAIVEKIHAALSDFHGATDVGSAALDWLSVGKVLLRNDARNEETK